MTEIMHGDEQHKTEVMHAIEQLEKAGLVHKVRGRWICTEKGEDVTGSTSTDLVTSQ